jgi:hypothetical protein
LRGLLPTVLAGQGEHDDAPCSEYVLPAHATTVWLPSDE